MFGRNLGKESFYAITFMQPNSLHLNFSCIATVSAFAGVFSFFSIGDKQFLCMYIMKHAYR